MSLTSKVRVRLLMAAALPVAAAIGSLAFAATPAMASPTPPHCESGLSTVLCTGTGTAPFTWTLIISTYGVSSGTDTYTTSTTYTKFGCESGEVFTVSYSYTSGGVTQTSPVNYIVCQTAPYQ
jgi:hypothetical protein